MRFAFFSLLLRTHEQTRLWESRLKMFNSPFFRFQVVCAKIVNVTGTCRRRRGFKLDEPVILTFDDELNERIDAELNQMDHQFLLNPTATLRYVF